jgi:hypothetical protein
MCFKNSGFDTSFSQHIPNPSSYGGRRIWTMRFFFFFGFFYLFFFISFTIRNWRHRQQD